MYGTEVTADESRRRLDALVPLFDGSERPVRAFAIEDEQSYAAMIDSETEEGEAPILWVGYWSASPRSDVLPGSADMEVIAAGGFDSLMSRRRFGGTSSSERRVMLREKDGSLTDMRPYTVSGFVAGWVGMANGATVALCSRVPLNEDLVIAETAEVGGFVRSWRRMIDPHFGIDSSIANI